MNNGQLGAILDAIFNRPTEEQFDKAIAVMKTVDGAQHDAMCDAYKEYYEVSQEIDAITMAQVDHLARCATPNDEACPGTQEYFKVKAKALRASADAAHKLVLAYHTYAHFLEGKIKN